MVRRPLVRREARIEERDLPGDHSCLRPRRRPVLAVAGVDRSPQVHADGSQDFVGDSDAVVAAARSWYPDRSERLNQAPGGLADGTAADGFFPAFFGIATTTPVSSDDVRDAAKREVRATAVAKWRACFEALEDVLERHPFLSGRDEPGPKDFKHFTFLRVAHVQVLQDWLDPAEAASVDSEFPRVREWRDRMAPRTADVVCAEPICTANVNLHLVHKFFKGLAPLLPARFQQLVDSFACDESDAEPEETREAPLSPGSPTGSAIQFCL